MLKTVMRFLTALMIGCFMLAGAFAEGEMPKPSPEKVQAEKQEKMPELSKEQTESEKPSEKKSGSKKVKLYKFRDDVVWLGETPSDPRGMQIPMLFQEDYTAVVCKYDGEYKNVATSGCGATSLSMVIAYLTGDTTQTPYSLFWQSVDDKKYKGEGWDHRTLERYAKKYGLSYEWIANDAELIVKALSENKPIIAHMGKGDFTEYGHYIVLRGVTEDGKVLVNDCASKRRSNKTYDAELIAKQGNYSNCFMVCWVK